MGAEVGQMALILALVMAVIQATAPMFGAVWENPILMRLGRVAALLQLGFIVAAFFLLMALFVINDFSVALVAQHSNLAQPVIYRAAATWGSHEGSMLLWVLILSIYGGAVAFFGNSLRETLQSRVLAVQGIIGAAFLGFSIFTSNPFLRLHPAPLDGTELNPLLQDPGLIGHPPLLYMGYVGFSATFAFAIAALIEGRIDASWSRWVRPWILASWIFLTIGITLGSIWSYYTLGWGGWWFWDPVENASLMPWLMGTALLHSSVTLEKRGAMASWTILLSIMTFSLSLIGTFLVRSGIISSVHAFALDAQRGVYILALVAVFTGLSLALFAFRAGAMRRGTMFAFASRESAISLTNLFLFAATATVFLGTFYPFFVDVLNGQKISVGPPYYRLTFVPIFIPLLVLAGIGPFLHWKRDSMKSVLRRMIWPILVAAFVFSASVLILGLSHIYAAFGIALGLWLIASAFMLVIRRVRMSNGFGNGVLRLGRTTPLVFWGMVMAHAGLGVMTVGVTAVSTWQVDSVQDMFPGSSVAIAGNRVTLLSIENLTGENFEGTQTRFQVQSRGKSYQLVSQRRFYPSSQSAKTQAGIGIGLTKNVYISMGDTNPDGSVVVRIWNHPFINWIWSGTLLMALGGAFSLFDQRSVVRVMNPSQTLSYRSSALA